MILKQLGVKGIGHDSPHSEEEIRALLRESHIHGDLTRSEHRLLDAVFEFDDTICRRIMVPRTDVELLLVGQSLADCLTQARRSRHTRFPLCEGSLDKVVGVIHIKELILRTDDDGQFDLRAIALPPKTVPENMPISKLLRHFQATHQHMAFIVDEYGTVIGIVTLENVIEQIVGAVQDEFDLETPDIVPEGSGQFIVQGSTPIDVVEKILNIYRGEDDVDTFSGLLMLRHGEILEAGDRIELTGAVAEVLETKNSRAERVRVTLNSSPAADASQSSESME